MKFLPRPSASGWFRMLFVQGFRIFFTLATLWAVGAMALWLAMVTGGLALASPWSPPHLHGHELLFGFVGAAAAGFLLTATPVWSKTPPMTGLPLIILASAWLVARLGVVFGCCLPAWLPALADAIFYFGMLLFLTPTMWNTGNRVHRIFPPILALLALGDLLTHLEALGWHAESARLGLMLGINGIVFFLAMTGGHIMPMFTRDTLRQRGEEAAFALSVPLEIAGVVTLTSVVVADLVWTTHTQAGWLFILAGMVQGVRLSRWHGWKTVSTPLLWVLHVGYAWLVMGLILRGVARLGIGLDESTALHGLTVGAMGLFTLGIMGRVALTHTGRVPEAGRWMTAAFLSMTGATFARVVLPFWWPEGAVMVAGGLWIGAYLSFGLLILPMLSTPRPDGQAG
ncbi:MAG: NnrS family protein [Magnetococcales bacterium]|nr:NnrS family protein [Magnetococcales bacterium]